MTKLVVKEPESRKALREAKKQDQGTPGGLRARVEALEQELERLRRLVEDR